MGKHGFQWKKTGGFDYDEHKNKLDRVALPEKILCKFCGKICNANKFSKRQLDELRKAMAYNTGVTGISRPGYAGCRSCVSHQTVELTCSICDKTKSLEFFSKNQRSSPDTARCKNCIQDHLDAEPIAEVIKELDDGETTFESTTAYQSELNDQTLSSFHTLSVNEGARVRNLMDGDDTASRARTQTTRIDQEDALSMGGVWIEQGRQHPPPSVDPSGEEGIEYVAYDNQGIPHARTAVPITQSVGEQSESTSWNIASRRRGPPATKRNSNFAKITGGRIPKNEGPTQRVPEPTGPTIESEDDSDDDAGVESWI
ncbi:uncharacterized protein GIQ15_05890 [Arthroderma uncinatum]|uniref:uncharacterized protein n=1 Tax=Arthroderma uncinatum TaxID=74035 RepID=UPI00144A5B10|nr:uncharacterized protein GIQ15_05890 [Arthroderma uncinatum]KAF3480543.1 hypothetical protein GIQ15_05890 [Arthroderma uncinatum]